MNIPISLDEARSEADFWGAVLRRIGRNVLNPVFVRDVLTQQERERAALATVDLGDEARFLMLNFAVHRVWTIGLTVKHEGGRRSYAMFEWESERTMRSGDRPEPQPVQATLLSRDLLDASSHPVLPREARTALERHAPGIASTIDLADLDAIGMLRVMDFLLRNNAVPGDALAMRRAYKHAVTMRDLVRSCFSRQPDLWDGKPIRDLGAD